MKSDAKDNYKHALMLLAQDTPEALEEVSYISYGNHRHQEIIYKAILESENTTPEMFKHMIHNIEFDFKKPEKDLYSGEIHYLSVSPNSYRFNNGIQLEDIDNYKPEAVSLLKEILKSPKNTSQTKGQIYDALYHIAENVEGSNADIFSTFIEGVNSKNADDGDMIAAVWKMDHLRSNHDVHQKLYPDQPQIDIDGIMDVFVAVADEKNAHKHTEESVMDFYITISKFADKEPHKVKDLVGKMMKLPQNSENTLVRAKNIIGGINITLAGNKKRDVVKE